MSVKSVSTSECFTFEPGASAPAVKINIKGKPLSNGGFALPTLNQVRGWLGLLNQFSLEYGYGTFSWQRIKTIEWDVTLENREVVAGENSFTAFMQFDPNSSRITQVCFREGLPYFVTVLPKSHWVLLTSTLNKVYGFKKVEIYEAYPIPNEPHRFIVDTSIGDIQLFVTPYRKYMALMPHVNTDSGEVFIDEEEFTDEKTREVISRS